MRWSQIRKMALSLPVALLAALLLAVAVHVRSSEVWEGPGVPAMAIHVALALFPLLFAGWAFLRGSALRTRLVSSFLLISLFPSASSPCWTSGPRPRR